MKTLFVLLSLILITGVSSAQAQEPASATPAAPPRLMAACESVIKGMGEHSNWISKPIQYSTTGAGGWIGQKASFQPPVPGMTAQNAVAIDGQFAMWSRAVGVNYINYIYTAYEISNAPDHLIYFRCKADSKSGAVIAAIERAPAQASADE